MIRSRLLATSLLLAFALVAPGCGNDDLDRARTQAQGRIDDARERVRERLDRFRERIEKVLADVQQAVPQARQTSPEVRARGRTEPGTIDAFLEDVLGNIDRYWTTTLQAAGRPEPRVGFVIVPAGRRLGTACGAPADDDAAFYCPRDDTIYVAQVFAAELYQGVLRGLPGERAGFGRAAGDFAVAYVLAHEYAHNVQQELGLFDNRVSPTAAPFELQADCLAGTWAHSAYEQGLVEPGDIEEALNTALAVGDFDVGNAQHHGTPEERRDALLVGYRDGDPASCSRYVPA